MLCIIDMQRFKFRNPTHYSCAISVIATNGKSNIIGKVNRLEDE